MPALFVGHGNPMNAIENNQFTQTWEKLGKEIPKPTSIICISAHWETNGIYVTGMENPKTIHDFGGFPQALFDVQYPAKGNYELAKKITEIVKSKEIKIDTTNWGLDHGAWSILVKMYPKADIPVIQVSLDRTATPEEHYKLAKELSILRKEGVLFVCSGNIIHNLRMVDWRNENNQYDWAKNVSESVKTKISNRNYKSLIDFNSENDEYKLAINSAEHFLPLIYLIGLENDKDEISFFNDEIVMGSLSMTGVIIK